MWYFLLISTIPLYLLHLLRSSIMIQNLHGICFSSLSCQPQRILLYLIRMPTIKLHLSTKAISTVSDDLSIITLHLLYLPRMSTKVISAVSDDLSIITLHLLYLLRVSIKTGTCYDASGAETLAH